MKAHLHPKLVCLCAGTILLSAQAQAEVTSLSSSELTETYIQDSTIIIAPKQQEEESKRKTVSSLTIAPVENTDQDITELENAQIHRDGTFTSFELDDDTLRNASVEAAINPVTLPDIDPYEDPTYYTPVAEILDDPRYQVPEGDFQHQYVGNDLTLGRTGDQVTFGIGNLPGIEQINLPHGIEAGGPVELVPREGGGFDLTINIPQDN